MKRFARYITIFMAVLMLAASSSGCKNVFSPKTQYSGRGGNQTRYGLYVFIDGQQLTHYPGGESLIQPGQETQVVYLTGSAKHHCLAYSYPDPTIFRQEFDAIVDNVSQNATLNGQTYDWVWRIGGSFQQRVQPTPPDSL